MGGGAKKAARIQAAATREAAEAAAKDNRLKAQAAQQQQESMINRQLAVDKAAQLEANQAKQTVETTIGERTDDNAAADEMGRRRRPRDAFRSNSSTGLRI